jgi:hypothetical protein
VLHCFDIFLEFIYRHFPPGWLTVILAVAAAVTALPLVTKRFDPEKNKWAGWLHAGAIFVFCGIAALEMAVINNADKVSEGRIKDLQGKIEIAVNNTTQIQGDLSGLIRSEKTASQAQSESASRHKISDELLRLKGRTASLAADIFNLLLQRSEMFTGRIMFSQARPATPQQSLAEEIPYDNETVLIYQQKFGAQTHQVIEELAAHGLKDETLATFAENSNNMISVRAIANHLAVQAERITPDGIKPYSRLPIP